MKTDKRVTNRQQKLRSELQTILREEASKAFREENIRTDSIYKRLMSLEKAGMEYSAYEGLLKEISSLRHVIRNQTSAIEGLLKFFNVSKALINSSNESDIITKFE